MHPLLQNGRDPENDGVGVDNAGRSEGTAADGGACSASAALST